MTTEKDNLIELQGFIRNKMLALQYHEKQGQKIRDEIWELLDSLNNRILNNDFNGVLSEDRNPPDSSKVQRDELVEDGKKE